jgi:dihydrofolate reductase
MVKHALIAALSWPRGVIGREGRFAVAYSSGAAGVSGSLLGGSILVMGRRTYESLRRPGLPGANVMGAFPTFTGPAGNQWGAHILFLGGASEGSCLRLRSQFSLRGGRKIFRRALELPSLERLYLSWVMVEGGGRYVLSADPEGVGGISGGRYLCRGAGGE